MTNLDYLHDLMYVYRKLSNNLVKTRESVDASEVLNLLVKDIQDLRKDLPENFSLTYKVASLFYEKWRT